MAYLIRDGPLVEGEEPGEDPPTLVIRAHPSRSEKAHFVRESELTVPLCLGAGGVPLRANEERVHRELIRHGDRLVVVRSEGHQAVAGFGQEFQRRVETVLRIDGATE